MHIKHKRVLAAAVLAAATVAAIGATAEANLPGSTFEGNDGNYVPNGGTDWTSPAPNRVIGNDLSTGQGDSSFGQGTAENDTTVTVGFGSIPNSKADLSQFLIANEQGANGHTYLYLGWTRNNQGGTTNFDFEINKLEQPNLTTAGSKTLNRSVGDLLVNYLFQGQGTPQIQIRTWTAAGVWSAATSGVVAEAAISAVSQANPFGTPNPVPAAQFGETSIDLTASGIIPQGSCRGFSSAYVKTRASTSFNSEVKDFVPPQHINLNTCSRIIVDKVTVPAGSTQSFHFNASYDADGFDLTDAATPNDSGELNPGNYSVSEVVPAGWTLTSAVCHSDSDPTTNIDPASITLGQNQTVTCTFTNQGLGRIIVRKHTDPAGSAQSFDFTASYPPGSFSLTDGQSNDSGQIPAGTYSVAETVPANWALMSATCDDGSSPSSIGLSPGETVTCDFNNQLQVGAITITKTRKHAADGPGDHPHAGVVFEVDGVALPPTNANGVTCVDGLFFGNHTVHEVTPAGYAGEADKTVNVDNVASCAGGGEQVTFHNTPLTDITVTVNSQVDGGTASTINCGAGPVSTGPNGDGSTSRLNLPPGTYTCTIVVDP